MIIHELMNKKKKQQKQINKKHSLIKYETYD